MNRPPGSSLRPPAVAGSAARVPLVRTIVGVLAELLNKLAVTDGSSDDTAERETLDDALNDARALLTGAAEQAAAAGSWTPDEPLRLTKNRTRWLLQCPRRAVAAESTTPGNVDDLLLGIIVDAAAKLLALGAARPVTVPATVAFLEAQDNHQVSEHLARSSDPAAAELVEEATVRLDQLNRLWPEIPAPWWPRVEEPVRVALADRSILISGRLDIVLGGPPTDRPGVIVEIKGGRWHDSARSETHFYSLLLGLRDGVAPSHVVSLAAADGAANVEEVRPAVYATVAAQLATVLDSAASIAAGEVPEARPGTQCTTCPVVAACPAQTDALGPTDRRPADGRPADGRPAA